MAFRQAFALCPYSPEAVFRYVQLLLQLNRLEDARLVAQTCLKLDPNNSQVMSLVENLKSHKPQRLAVSIDPKGVLRLGLDAKPVTIERLEEELLAAAAKTPDLTLVISADKNAPYEVIANVMDASKEAKIKAVSVTTKEAGKP